MSYNKDYTKSEIKQKSLALPHNQLHAGTKLGMINKMNIARNIIANDSKNLADMHQDKDQLMINKFGMHQKKTFFSGSLSGTSNLASS